MELFQLNRKVDESEISGTGIIAQGVVFDDGTVVMRWLTKRASTTFYQNIDDVRGIHGHDGSTVLEWVLPRPVRR